MPTYQTFLRQFIRAGIPERNSQQAVDDNDTHMLVARMLVASVLAVSQAGFQRAGSQPGWLPAHWLPAMLVASVLAVSHAGCQSSGFQHYLLPSLSAQLADSNAGKCEHSHDHVQDRRLKAS